MRQALTDAQFVLMSATLGDVTEIAADPTRRNGRETTVIDKAERPVPLHFSAAGRGAVRGWVREDAVEARPPGHGSPRTITSPIH